MSFKAIQQKTHQVPKKKMSFFRCIQLVFKINGLRQLELQRVGVKFYKLFFVSAKVQFARAIFLALAIQKVAVGVNVPRNRFSDTAVRDVLDLLALHCSIVHATDVARVAHVEIVMEMNMIKSAVRLACRTFGEPHKP